MQPVVDLRKPLTLMEFGHLVGISFQHAGRLVERGTLRHGAPAIEWVHSYCARLREEAAGRATSSGLSLADERAALARAHRERVELDNATRRHEMVRVEEFTRILAAIARLVRGPLEALPVRIKRAYPNLPQEAVGAIQAVVVDALRAVAHLADDPLALEAELERDTRGTSN